jgi:hypothetical protein
LADLRAARRRAAMTVPDRSTQRPNGSRTAGG